MENNDKKTKDKKKTQWWGWIGLAIIILVIIGFSNDSSNKNSKKSSQEPSGVPSSVESTIVPSISDIEIVSYRGEWQRGRYRILGEIRNNGKVPVGAKVEAIARDKNGQLIDSKQFWPNSTSNIPIGGTVGVGFTITEDPKAEKMELKIINVEVWK